MKKTLLKYLPLVVLAVAAAARAQGGDVGSGCDSSPENPTIILALVGSAGTAGAMLRNRLRARRAKKNETAI